MNILVPMSSIPDSDDVYLSVTVQYHLVNSKDKKPKEIYFEAKRSNDDRDHKETVTEIEIHSHRVAFVSLLRTLMLLMETERDAEAQDLISSLVKTIKGSDTSDQQFVVDLLQDLEGQVSEAVSKQVCVALLFFLTT